jgi:DNA-binding NarL/FixJ family response regulator
MDVRLNAMIVTWTKFLGAAVSRVVQSQPAFHVVGVEQTKELRCAAWARRRLDAIVVAGLDAPRPQGPAIAAVLERLCSLEPAVPVVALLPDECLCMHFLHGIVGLGVASCLEWQVDEGDFLNCLRSVSKGSLHHGPRASALLREYASWTDDGGTRGAGRQLTPKEREVVELLLQSLTVPQIARRLGRAKGTIQTHCKRLYEKVGVSDRVGLYRWWITCGYGNPESDSAN